MAYRKSPAKRSTKSGGYRAAARSSYSSGKRSTGKSSASAGRGVQTVRIVIEQPGSRGDAALTAVAARHKSTF